MKKIVCLIIAVLMTISAFSLIGCDDKNNSSNSGLLYKKLAGDSFYTVYDFVLDKGEDGSYKDIDENGVIDIQKIVGDEKIGAISKEAFKDISNVKKVIVPDTVEEIGAGAFANMIDLEELVVPFIGLNATGDSTYNATSSSVNKAVNYARTMYYWFATNDMDDDACEISNEELDGLATITIKSKESDDEQEFYMPCNFKTLTINAKNNYTIPMYACYGSILTTVNFNSNIEGIGDSAFEGCEYLIKVVKNGTEYTESNQSKKGQELVKSAFVD